MAKEDDMILFRIEDGVGIITLNRPDKLNAVSWELAEELSQLLLSLRYNDDVRTLLLHGAGRAFCAGGDVDFISGDSDRPHAGYFRRLPSHSPFTTQNPWRALL